MHSNHHSERKSLRYVVRCLSASALLATPALAANDVKGTLLTFKQNGGWCWFEDSRVLMDGNKMLVGTVAGVTARGSTAGDVQVTTFDLSTNTASTFTLAAAFERDDHDSPVFLKRPDGRYLAVYQKHGGDDIMRSRVSVNPGDTSSWRPVQNSDANNTDGHGVTYANLFQLSGESNRIYNFVRAAGYDTNYLVSTDDGNTFTYGGRVLTWNNNPGRPYVRYASNNVDTVWLTTTEDHPRNYNNSIYAGFLKAGNLYRSDGTLVGPLSTTSDGGHSPQAFTRIFQGDASNVAWTVDLELDSSGNPYAIFQVRKSNSPSDIRYHYARFDGTNWTQRQIAFAGSYLYAAENDYSGLAALDPSDPNTVFISSNVNPGTGDPLVSKADGKRHWEIFQGKTADGGESWTWEPITWDSTLDNIRPVIPRSTLPNQRVVTWLRGSYTTYTNYDLNVVGIVQAVPEPSMLTVLALPLAGLSGRRTRRQRLD